MRAETYAASASRRGPGARARQRSEIASMRSLREYRSNLIASEAARKEALESTHDKIIRAGKAPHLSFQSKFVRRFEKTKYPLERERGPAAPFEPRRSSTARLRAASAAEASPGAPPAPTPSACESAAAPASAAAAAAVSSAAARAGSDPSAAAAEAEPAPSPAASASGEEAAAAALWRLRRSPA